MFHHNYHHAVVGTPPITPVAPTTNTNANTVTAAAAAATTTSSSRSFADYRYAIEAGLISPHHERYYIPSWEQQPSQRYQTSGGVVSSRGRSGKRYFTPSSDEDDEEEGGGDANQMMTFQYQGAVREGQKRRYGVRR